MMYEYGRYVPQNVTVAARLYLKGAEAGLAEAQYYLGLMIAYGRGFQQDFTLSLSFFHQAANQNHAPAQIMLGKMYTHGQGVPIDYAMATMWFDRASHSEILLIREEAQAHTRQLKHLLHQVEANMDRVHFQA